MATRENNADNASLSAALQQQDQAQVEALLAQHRGYLHQVIEARMNPALGRRVDASDVVQEAQIEAMRDLDRFLQDPQVPLKIWLRKLAIQRLIMAERKHLGAAQRALGRERRASRSSVDIANQLSAGLLSPSQVVSKQETADTVRRSLERLPEIDREIILMHLYEGLNSQESAAALGIEPAAARKRLGRAVQRFKKLLESQNLGESSL